VRGLNVPVFSLLSPLHRAPSLCWFSDLLIFSPFHIVSRMLMGHKPLNHSRSEELHTRYHSHPLHVDLASGTRPRFRQHHCPDLQHYPGLASSLRPLCACQTLPFMLQTDYAWSTNYFLESLSDRYLDLLPVKPFRHFTAMSIFFHFFPPPPFFFDLFSPLFAHSLHL